MVETSDAAALLARVQDRQPDVFRLARIVSLAARVEPELLRSARLALLPGVEAGAEADLWFSPLVYAESPSALVLVPEVVEILRKSLAGDQHLLDRAWDVLSQVHRNAPPAIQLEEQVTWLALSKQQDAPVRLENELLSAVVAMVRQERRGVAQWAVRALPRLPEAAHRTDAWKMLGIGAGARVGRTAQFPIDEMHEWLPWVLPDALPQVTIDVRLHAGAVEFGAAAMVGAHTITLPDTDPVALEVSWQGDDGRQTEQVRLRDGQRKMVPVGPGPLTIRTVAGETYTLTEVSFDAPVVDAAPVVTSDPSAPAGPDGPAPRRTAAQLKALPATTLPPGGPFGPALDWPYRGYNVAASLARGDRLEADVRETLCLFNVIVALEWYPDDGYLTQLGRAFQHASAYLYDITDGYMAFGQVIFGGPEWLDCADIQIMASNRLFPRSFVDGMNIDWKYRPIRVGRGLWNKAARRTMGWDEPEAYRSLVHEWAHYALALTDQYLIEKHVPLADAASEETRPYSLVIPGINLPFDLPRASEQGASELTALRPLGVGHDPRDEWGQLARKPQFTFLEVPEYHQPKFGPSALPLPLPYFSDLTREPGGVPAHGGEIQLRVPYGIVREHCWVYVVRGSLAEPKQIIAQGTLESRSGEQGFALLGATSDDIVVLIGNIIDRNGVQVRWRSLAGDWTQTPGDIAEWNDATPRNAPLAAAVVSGEFRAGGSSAEQNRQPAPVGAVIGIGGVLPRGGVQDRVLIFPSGKALVSDYDLAPTNSPRVAPETLDGYLYTSWDRGKRLMISAYSQGGGPEFSVTVPDNPINPTSGGSPEGDAMVFFGDETGIRNRDDADLRLVTTVLLDGPERLPGASGDSRAHSYTFGLSSNQPLPDRLNATLVLAYDPFEERDAGELAIYRQIDEERWIRLPTYLDPATTFAATPLRDPVAGGSLREPELASSSARVERYRLYWVRRT